ncbi:hypothetical protein BESB_038640 [Besnoitia besnoiti]|uniref:Exostosin GT47 domain-containing protein n=1 Tax=Besnoitia besnoiti TaxID=94643 RepID=A0A2A9MMQ1_BESBE|nr:hypothetical protein BESB_038640 [Besnoitia besnoiti]PFH37406.1 hypothetical protein BESB_038640 [Besnoitia besnoiti]
MPSAAYAQPRGEGHLPHFEPRRSQASRAPGPSPSRRRRLLGYLLCVSLLCLVLFLCTFLALHSPFAASGTSRGASAAPSDRHRSRAANAGRSEGEESSLSTFSNVPSSLPHRAQWTAGSSGAGRASAESLRARPVASVESETRDATGLGGRDPKPEAQQRGGGDAPPRQWRWEGNVAEEADEMAHEAGDEPSRFEDGLGDDAFYVVHDEEARKWMERPEGAPIRRRVWQPLDVGLVSPASAGDAKAAAGAEPNALASQKEVDVAADQRAAWRKQLNPLEDVFVSAAGVPLFPAERLSQCLRRPASLGDLRKAVGGAGLAGELGASAGSPDARRGDSETGGPRAADIALPETGGARAAAASTPSFIATTAKYGANDRKGTVEKTQRAVAELLRDLSKPSGASLLSRLSSVSSQAGSRGALASATSARREAGDADSLRVSGGALGAGLSLPAVGPPAPGVRVALPAPEVLREAYKLLASPPRDAALSLLHPSALGRGAAGEAATRGAPSDEGRVASELPVFLAESFFEDLRDVLPPTSLELALEAEEDAPRATAPEECFSRALRRGTLRSTTQDLRRVALHPLSGFAALVQQEAVMSLLFRHRGLGGAPAAPAGRPEETTRRGRAVAPVFAALVTAEIFACALERSADSTPAAADDVGASRLREPGVALAEALRGAALYSVLALSSQRVASAEVAAAWREQVQEDAAASAVLGAPHAATPFWLSALPLSLTTSFFPDASDSQPSPRPAKEAEKGRIPLNGGGGSDAVEAPEGENRRAASRRDKDRAPGGRPEPPNPFPAALVLEASVATAGSPQLAFAAPEGAPRSWDEFAALAASLSAKSGQEAANAARAHEPLLTLLPAAAAAPLRVASRGDAGASMPSKGFDPRRDVALPPATSVQLAALAIRGGPAASPRDKEARETRGERHAAAQITVAASAAGAALLLHLVPWILLPEILSCSPFALLASVGGDAGVLDDRTETEMQDSLEAARSLVAFLAKGDGELSVKTAADFDDKLRQTLRPVSLYQLRRARQVVQALEQQLPGGSFFPAFFGFLRRRASSEAESLVLEELAGLAEEAGPDGRKNVPRMRGSERRGGRGPQGQEATDEQAETEARSEQGRSGAREQKQIRPGMLVFGRRDFDVVLFSSLDSRGPLTEVVIRSFVRPAQELNSAAASPVVEHAADGGRGSPASLMDAGEGKRGESVLELLDVEAPFAAQKTSVSRAPGKGDASRNEPDALRPGAASAQNAGEAAATDLAREDTEKSDAFDVDAGVARAFGGPPEAKRALCSWIRGAARSFFISRATFCLCPQEGWMPSRCVFESLAHACVPVAVGGETELWLPGGCLFDWTEMAVFIPRSRAPYASQILSEITDEELLEKQQMVWKVRQHFLYDLSQLGAQTATTNDARRPSGRAKPQPEDGAAVAPTLDARRLALLEMTMRTAALDG